MTVHDWRYLAGGEVRHAMRSRTSTGAVCGLKSNAGNWLGVGTEQQAAVLAGLPECAYCARAIGRAPLLIEDVLAEVCDGQRVAAVTDNTGRVLAIVRGAEVLNAAARDAVLGRVRAFLAEARGGAR